MVTCELSNEKITGYVVQALETLAEKHGSEVYHGSHTIAGKASNYITAKIAEESLTQLVLDGEVKTVLYNQGKLSLSILYRKAIEDSEMSDMVFIKSRGIIKSIVPDKKP